MAVYTPREQAIEHLSALILVALEAPKEEREKRIKVLTRTIIDYSTLTMEDVGRIDEAYSEVFD